MAQYPDFVGDRPASENGEMIKICVMAGVREYSDGDQVELWRYNRSGRLVIRASNESGNDSTEVDLWDILDWLSGPHRGVLEDYPNVGNAPGRSLGSGN